MRLQDDRMKATTRQASDADALGVRRGPGPDKANFKLSLRVISVLFAIDDTLCSMKH